MYINLKHNDWRKKRIGKELSKINILNPIRFEAIESKYGEIGCLKSHIKVLEIARDKKWPYVVVCEDDIEIEYPEILMSKTNNFINSGVEWDVLLLLTVPMMYSDWDKNVIKVSNSYSSGCYIVQNHYFNTLLNYYKQTLKELVDYVNSRDIPTGIRVDEGWKALDARWEVLQKRDNWFMVYPRAMRFWDSYSNIIKNEKSVEVELKKKYEFKFY